VGETAFVHRLAQEASSGPTLLAAGIVGFADLSRGAAVTEVLESHLAASPRVRGIRHASAWHPSDKIHNAHTQPPPELMADLRFREGFACLQPLGLTFDAWLYHPQLPELLDLARAFPGVNIVLDHMAGPLGIGPYSNDREQVFEAWRADLARLAGCENVYLKLGGRAMTNAGFGWHKREKPPGSTELADAMAPYFHAAIALFGPGRCMFESNFPVDRASCSYTVLWNAFKRVSADYSATERAALMHDTAAGFYRLT
jgi:predicted TIM-barrel fold metal-dependent hydrolase